jgi:hypothetical protein
MTLKLVRSAPKPLAGLYTAGRKRKQAVSTPPWFVGAVCEAMRLEQVPLDPCAHRDPLRQFARTNWTRGGLTRPWELPGYANPPYEHLVYWLAYAQAEALRTGLPTAFLGPWRSHRIGFCDALAGSEVVFLKAFPFLGHRNSPPFPLFAATWHCKLPRTPWEMDRRPWYRPAMAGFDPERWAALLRGGAELLESREKRLEFKARFGDAAAEAAVKLLVRGGVDPQLIELIRKDLGL